MTFSKRSVLNLNFPYSSEYFGINLEKWNRVVPDHAQFTGKYVCKWTGLGCRQDLSGTLTADDALSTSYTHTDGHSDLFEATSPRLVFDYSGSGGGITMQWALGKVGTNLQFYRLEDETDLLAGKVYRRAALQQIVDFNPSSIRFVNWFPPNDAHLMRWESRALPADAQYTSQQLVTSGGIPTYGTTSGVNQMTLGAIGSTPVSMQHGEVVECTIGSGMARAGVVTVSAITKANPGVVTATAHGFNTGDVIVHTITAGMTQLHNVPCTITVSDVNTYSVGVNTTAYTTFTAGLANQYITLNVGSRGAYPVIYSDGTTPASNYGNAQMATSDVKAFYFDKTMVASTTVNGAWIFNGSGTPNHHFVGVPLEICVAFMNELNALAAAQGKGPFDMWVSVPHRGLLSVDADYSAGSNVALGMMDVTFNGANGYAELLYGASVFVEMSNETWNTFGAFNQSKYFARRGFLRWGGSASDYFTFHTLRSCIMVSDIRAAYPGNSRIKFVMAGWGTFGIGGSNDIRINGSATLDSDATFIALGGGDPMDYHDAYALATYFTINGSAYEASSLATLATSYAAATTDDAREALFSSYCAQVYNEAANQTVALYISIMQAAAAAMVLRGKVAINYEGGWDRAVTGETTAINNFLAAVKRSKAWSAVLGRLQNAVRATAGWYMPACPYQMVDQRWGDAYPDTWANGVEGGNLCEAWQQVKQYNNAKRRVYVGWGS